MAKIFVTAIICPACQDQIWSRHRHDFRYCKCGECFVDGGRDYMRIGYKDTIPTQVEIEVDVPKDRPDRFPY